MNQEFKMRATRSVLIRDLLIFQLKLWMDGFKDILMIQLSIVAAVVDLVLGGRRQRLFYKVIRLSERIDLWLNLHGVLARGDTSDDGLFGASKAGSNTMLGQLEQLMRGGDEPRGGRNQ